MNPGIFIIKISESEAMHPGIRYVLNYLFNQRLNVPWKLEPAEAQTKKLEIQYVQEGNLAKSSIVVPLWKIQEPITVETQNQQSSTDLTWRFDLIQTLLFVLSRQEEHQRNNLDLHGRFDVQHAQIPGHRAYLDHWIETLRIQVNQLAGFEISPKPAYRYQLTIDIDQVFAYRCKGFARNFKGGLRQLMRGDFSGYVQRMLAITGTGKDPFDVYHGLEDFCNSNHIRPLVFVHAGLPGQFDKQVNLNCKAAQKAINHMASFADIGLHPSYFASENKELLREEKSRLEQIVGSPITKSRFHYLKMHLPESYEHLIAAGITDDYTMGHASKPGYRAGTSHPFPFFNMERNEERPLTIHPFQVMDTTFIRYMPMNQLEALAFTRNMAKDVSDLGGIFTLLVHNEMPANQDAWKGWGETYKKLLETGLLA